jgi:hypothetical protein
MLKKALQEESISFEAIETRGHGKLFAVDDRILSFVLFSVTVTIAEKLFKN